MPTEMDSLRCEGWIVALYIENQFIEHFDTAADAKRFAEKYYKSQKYFIRPVCYLSYKKDSDNE